MADRGVSRASPGPYSSGRGDDSLRIPHPLECQAYRPRREPRWSPRRDRRDAGSAIPRRSVAERWHEPALLAAEDTGHIRINFTYNNVITTTAGYSRKARRAQYHEGPVEAAAWVEAEVLTSRTDLQFQPITVTWRTADGGMRRLTLDGGFETESGELVFEEYKGGQAYFDDPHTRDLLDEARAVLAAEGATLAERDGSELLEPVRYRTLKDVFDDRRTRIDPDRDPAAALAAIDREGGAAPLGRVLEALGGSARRASARANAMMCRRLIRIDLSRPQMPDTLVDVPPPPAAPGLLRAFLRRHVQ